MTTINVDIGIDDLMWGMSKRDKEEMAKILHDDGIILKELQHDLDMIADRKPNGNSEDELNDLLDRVWSNRMFLNSNDIETLKHLSKKGL
jgi:hypothetical protein